MKNKYLQNIELYKIVEMAVERAACAETKERMRSETLQTRPEDVRYLLAQTDALASHLLIAGNPRLSSCEGANHAVERAKKSGILSMGELLLVADALRNFGVLVNWFRKEEETQTPVDDLFYSVSAQPQLYKAITEAIISDVEMADTASDELYQLRRKIRQAENAIRDKLDSVVKNPGNAKHLQEAIISIRNGRFVVPVKAEHRGEIAGVIHDVSSSGGTLFVEPSAVVEANAKILQLRSQEQQEIERILEEFSASVADIAPFFEASYESMLEIDKRIAKAELGLWMNGICPAVNETQAFNLVKARHPLLDKKTAVPVDIKLGASYDALVITGPNTGGKTVTLKTAGLLCAMAQMGYLLPAHDTSCVCVFEEFLVDIGDEQSIEQSLSTFSGHMKNITEILQLASPKSLVLMDELGAGTDPAEGAALAVAIIEQLRSTGTLVMATTHYAELKMFALETPGVQNAGSEFNVETLRSTYRLIVGVPGRSNAFLIGEKLGIPAEVIANARKHMSAEQQRFETVLVQLEDMKLALKEQEEEMERLRYAADHQVESARQKRDELIQQGEQELAMARQKAKAMADEVQNSAFTLMDEMKRLEKDQRITAAQKAQRAREIARKESEVLYKRSAEGAGVTPKFFAALATVSPGQEVYYPGMDKVAVVAAGPDKAGLVEIRMGAVKTKVPLAELSDLPKTTGKTKPAAKRKITVTERSGKSDGPVMRTPQMEINLLGLSVDEALMETDMFISNAIMSGLSVIYIIHGVGTGALRNAIRQHLRKNKQVKSFRPGQYGEGENGVTVVELK